MVQWDDARLLACARGELSMTGDMTMIQQTTPLNSSNTGLYAQLTTLTPPGLPQEHIKLLQQAGVDATWIPDSVEHSSLYEDNILKLTGGSWVPDPSRLPSIVPTAICCMGIDSKKTIIRGPLRPYYQYGVVRFTSLFSHTPPQLGRCLMSMSNTMICGATKIWYYVPEKSSGAFEAWLNATRPGYIENLEAGTHSFVPSLSPEEMARLDIKRIPQNAGETVEMQGCSWRWSLSTGFSISEEACNWFTEEVCTPEALKGLYKRWQMYVAKQKISRDRADELLEMASHVYGCLKTV
ncbi:hypothetical protein WJX82_006989 [Trebouxia sp. C0006]